MMSVGHVLDHMSDHVLDHVPDHVSDHMIIGLVATALQNATYLNIEFGLSDVTKTNSGSSQKAH